MQNITRAAALSLLPAAFLTTLPARADHLEELVITATHDTRTIDVTSALMISPDVAQLLKMAPGVTVNSNGPLTGIPQYRGMYGPRISTSLDGAQLAPSGPNWMDPPLSYAAGGQLESLEIYRGIVPVSVAQESIGGAIAAKTQHGEFTTTDAWSLNGKVIASAQSINDGYHLNTAVFASNNQYRFKLAAMTESGNDAEIPGGEIRPSQYQRERYDFGYGWRSGNHTLQFDYGYNDTGDSGTAVLPMDIETIKGKLYNLSYNYNLDSSMHIAASFYGSDLEHSMSNYHLRSTPPPARLRRNDVEGDNVGFKLSTTLIDSDGAWVFGLDGFSEAHDSDISNPNNPMFFVTNFNNAEREILGAFVERQHNFSSHWRGEVGVRFNSVAMDADTVDGTPAMMMPPAMQLRDAFNSADRTQTDNNLDLVIKAWYDAGDNTSWYAGVSQKYRSPSYQERYLWLPLEATGGLADGFTYTGNINLNPERAREIEFGFDYGDSRLTLSPRIFYRNVDDYIEGTPSSIAPAVMFVRMMNAMSGTSNPDPLQFNNVDAELYGFDMDWALQLSQAWSLSGIVNYVRGKRSDDSNDNLYRIAPLNGTFRLGYAASNWATQLEGVVYAEQDEVSAINAEQESSGYGIVNWNATLQASASLQLAIGVDNLFDREYRDHLSGYNRASNPDIERGTRLPGYGRNVFARVLYEF
ncbi:MAG: iron complex outermembrane receptor protein [Halioglobus sp.]|jgi:iron complex outermembrane receptor protein